MSQETSQFETTADVEKTRSDRFKTRFYKNVFVPLEILWGDARARAGALILLFYILMGTVGVVLIEPPSTNQGPQLLGAFQTMEHPLGTTAFGADLVSLTVHSTPPILKMMLAGALFTSVVALVVGMYSGYKGGTVDRIVSTVTDTVMVIPGLPLFLVLAVFFEPRSPYVVGVLLSVNRWAGLARQVRSEVLKVRQEMYVEASRAIGLPLRRIMRIDLLPAILSFVMIRFVGAARGIIYSAVALYFLGILPVSGANWGVTLNRAWDYGNALNNPDAYHWLLVPMFAIIFISLGLILLAQGTDRLFNPRIRARYETDDESMRVE
jgi:peptide/nickel transport system permease protein